MTENFEFKVTWKIDQIGDEYFVVETTSIRFGAIRYGPMPPDKIGVFVDSRKTAIERAVTRAREAISAEFFSALK